MGRILAIRFSSLGDIALTFPALEYLKSQGHEVHVLTKEAFAPLVLARGVAARVHEIPNHATLGQLSAVVQKLNSEKFDQVLDLHRNLRSRIVSWKLGRPTRRIRKYRWRELVLFLLHRKLATFLGVRPIDRAQETMRVAVGKANVADVQWRMAGATPDSRGSSSMAVGSAEVVDARSWMGRFPRGIVCVALESAWKQKEWPAERFIEVASALRAEGHGIVWLGLRSLPTEAMREGCLDLTGRLTLPQVSAVLASARVLVCNDAGLMHVAEVVGTPVVAVFGPTSREIGFAPRLPESQVVESDLWCRPCSKTGRWCFRPVVRRKCLDEVSVADVLGAARTVLEKSGKDARA